MGEENNVRCAQDGGSAPARIFKWDNIRALLIFFVVFGHIVTHYTDFSSFYRSMYVFIYAFHMPFFIFVSGYFHKNVNIKNKVVFYLLMAVLLRFLLFTVHDLILGAEGELELASNEGIQWFMFAMAAFIALTYFLHRYNKIFVLVIAVIFGCFAGYDPDINDILVLSRIIVFYPFYWAGYCLQDSAAFRRLALPQTRQTRIGFAAAGAAILALWAACCFLLPDLTYQLRPFLTGRNPFEPEFAQSFAGLLTRLLCYLISGLLCFSFILLVPDRKIPVVTMTGQRSLGIYFWHRALIYFLTEYGVIRAVYSGQHTLLAAVLLAAGIVLLFDLPFWQGILERMKRMIMSPALYRSH